MKFENVQSLLAQNQQAMIEAEATLTQLHREVEADDDASINAAELELAVDCLYEAARHIACVRRRINARGGA
ncbi:hypothetical protein [Pseudonocardia sp. TMWB2A]|uniref:hypothetical protein n=1 Tax=Pseudonocardia sp. TMWB2A TaxID=687430 RepID=UPI00307D8772